MDIEGQNDCIWAGSPEEVRYNLANANALPRVPRSVQTASFLDFWSLPPLVGAACIVEQDGRILAVDRADGLGVCLPGGIVRSHESVEQGLLREASEETGYSLGIKGLMGCTQVQSGIPASVPFVSSTLLD